MSSKAASQQLLEFEVKCPDTLAYYPCDIVDFHKKTRQVEVRYEDDWRKRMRVDFADVRPAPDKYNPEEWHPKEKEQVEARARSEENEPYSWWLCTIQCIKNEFFLIQFDGWEDQYNEILIKDMLRPKNNKPSIDSLDITRDEIKVPSDVADWVSGYPDTVMQVKQKCNLFQINFNKKKKVLSLLGSPKQVRKATKLYDCIFKQQKEQQELEKSLKETNIRLENAKEEHKNSLREIFIFKKVLIRYVIGKQGKNIKDAQKIPDVIRIKINDQKCECEILAKSRQALQEAREMMEIVQHYFRVPNHQMIMPRLIGKKRRFNKRNQETSWCFIYTFFEET